MDLDDLLCLQPKDRQILRAQGYASVQLLSSLPPSFLQGLGLSDPEEIVSEASAVFDKVRMSGTERREKRANIFAQKKKRPIEEEVFAEVVHDENGVASKQETPALVKKYKNEGVVDLGEVKRDLVIDVDEDVKEPERDGSFRNMLNKSAFGAPSASAGTFFFSNENI
jgi:hypothetical protein